MNFFGSAVLNSIVLSTLVLSGCKEVEKEMMVTTGEVIEFTAFSADAPGQIIDLGNGVIDYGHCFGTSPNVTIADFKTQKGIPTGIGIYTSQLMGLTHSTKYYVKAYVSSEKETVYGKEVSFTTSSASIPVLTTIGATAITASSAQSGGDITSNGDAAIIERGVVWGQEHLPSLIVNMGKTSDGNQTGTFVSSLTSLNPEKVYYVRAFATNSVGTGYGNEVEFTTTSLITEPTVTTAAITAETSNSAMGGGDVTSDGNSAILSKGIVWSKFENPSTSAHEGLTNNGTGTGVFSSSLTGLASSSVYYVRAYATNSIGTSYGAQVSFTTLAAGIPTTVTDVDLNVYPIVTIGTQVWMAENLKTTKYKDSTPIDYPGSSTGAWSTNINGAYAWYNNEESTYKNTYGALYNFYAVHSGKLCPAGWRAPTESDWQTLIDYLGADPGGKLKETGTNHWNAPNTGAVNTTNFTALPGGRRTETGNFIQINTYGYFWIDLDFSMLNGKRHYMRETNTSISKEESTKANGLSVRCIKE